MRQRQALSWASSLSRLRTSFLKTTKKRCFIRSSCLKVHLHFKYLEMPHNNQRVCYLCPLIYSNVCWQLCLWCDDLHRAHWTEMEFVCMWTRDTLPCASHLLEVCASIIEWYRCRKVKAVTAWNWKRSFSEMIFSMRPRSDTVNLHWLMRISSCVDDTSHLSSTTLAAMWRQPMLMQARCLGWTFKADNWHFSSYFAL